MAANGRVIDERVKTVTGQSLIYRDQMVDGYVSGPYKSGRKNDCDYSALRNSVIGD